jgi:hypothetical protein
VTENSLSVPAYDPTRGVVAPAEGGNVVVEIVNGSVEIFGDPAGLRDLARLCLALADPYAPDGAHVHLDPGVIPLELSSASLMLARHVPRLNQ